MSQGADGAARDQLRRLRNPAAIAHGHRNRELFYALDRRKHLGQRG
jgi:hypothetical protein